MATLMGSKGWEALTVMQQWINTGGIPFWSLLHGVTKDLWIITVSGSKHPQKHRTSISLVFSAWLPHVLLRNNETAQSVGLIRVTHYRVAHLLFFTSTDTCSHTHVSFWQPWMTAPTIEHQICHVILKLGTQHVSPVLTWYGVCNLKRSWKGYWGSSWSIC